MTEEAKTIKLNKNKFYKFEKNSLEIECTLHVYMYQNLMSKVCRKRICKLFFGTILEISEFSKFVFLL